MGFICMRHCTMIFLYEAKISRRSNFYSQLLQNHCAVLKERWHCTTLVSLDALLCLHETCREQLRRADGPKHHIAPSFCCSSFTDPMSPSRPLWYLLRAERMGSQWDMMCCDHYCCDSRDILEALSTPSEITSCSLFFGTSDSSVSCLEYRKFNNSSPLHFICWEKGVESRLLCGIEDSRVQSYWRLMYLGVKRKVKIYIGMLKSDVPAHLHLWMFTATVCMVQTISEVSWLQPAQLVCHIKLPLFSNFRKSRICRTKLF